MRTTILLALTLALTAGCTVMDENPDWSPQTDYPPWMYDAPFYYRPSQDLPVVETLNGIPIYHSPNEYFFVRHPGGYQVAGEARVGVWSSIDKGHKWEKCGYFGVEQSHFLYHADVDGPHWVRFVGPGQGTSTVPPGMPHRIYIADSEAPRIVLSVTPSPWMDEEKEIPRKFKAGQSVTLQWIISDKHLDRSTPKMQLCFARFPHNVPWLTLPEKLKRSGRTTIEIPKQAGADGGLRFRISAADKSGNVGMTMTDILHVISKTPPKLRAHVKPVKKTDLVTQTQGTPGEKIGWPANGALLRGRANRVLVWLPKSAKEYNSIELEFSPNNSQTWDIVAKGLKPKKANKWTVPAINSKNCRLRLVGVNKKGQRYMLVISPRFTVATTSAGNTFGPKLIRRSD